MPNTGREPAVPAVVHVAAGLLIEGGRVFVTRRHASSHQGGLWEFPGGKVAARETVRSALARELYEELGIEVLAARPFVQLPHAYADRTVVLDVWRIESYRGAPHGREGQDGRWAEIATLRPSEFPDADRPVLRRLQLPPLYLITDAARFGFDVFRPRLERALNAGARLIQVREPQLAPDEYRRYATAVVSLCHRYGAKVLVNADPGIVSACGADGVHLNGRRLAQLDARPLAPDLWVGASCHDAADLKRAQAIAVDFAVLAPVRPTPSHRNAVPLGWEQFTALCRSTYLPVYALGGMQPEDVSPARAAGAAGVAMISGVWDRPDFEAAIAAIV